MENSLAISILFSALDKKIALLEERNKELLDALKTIYDEGLLTKNGNMNTSYHLVKQLIKKSTK